MKSAGKIRDFYAFGIYGRDFSLDSQPEKDSAGILMTSSVLIAMMVIAVSGY
jgi:hypothetical protein